MWLLENFKLHVWLILYLFWTTVYKFYSSKILLYNLVYYQTQIDICVFCEVEWRFIVFFLFFWIQKHLFKKHILPSPSPPFHCLDFCHKLGRSVSGPSILFHWPICPCTWVSKWFYKCSESGIDPPLCSSSRLSWLFLALCISMWLTESINYFPQTYFPNIWLGSHSIYR